MEFKNEPLVENQESFDNTGLIETELCKMLNKQKDNELYNHHLYKQIANYFKLSGLLKIHEYYEKRAYEEYNHHAWIVEYLNETGVSIEYSPIEIKEDVNFKDFNTNSMISMFELTLEKEFETTEKIGLIYKKAVDCLDFVTATWLQKQLIPEQHEEEATSLKALQIAQQESDWLTKEISILELLEDGK